MKKQMELLAPAGSYDGFLAALGAGADAVYAAGTRFGARAFAHNFTQEELLSAIGYAHLHGKKFYLTVNTLLKQEELSGELDALLSPLYCAGLDGVIVQDVGVLSYLRAHYPKLPLHASTQMTVTGIDSALLLKKFGVRRVVPARELHADELAAIKRESGLELEVFVHGALCYCYSGLCFFSSLLGGRSGNRGRCAQPCRLPYTANGKSGKLLSMRDLCALPLLPQLAKIGVDSLKIEGRMKSAAYTAGVVSVYRTYLDRLAKDPAHFAVEPDDLKKLQTLYNRGGAGTTTGYFLAPDKGTMVDPAPQQKQETHVSDDDAAQLSASRLPALSADASVILCAGAPAVLSLTCKGHTVTVTGDTVQAAKNQPLRTEDIAAQLSKTGGTPFVIGTFACDTDGACFLPKQALNALRRNGLQALEKELLAPFARTFSEKTPAAPDETIAAGNTTPYRIAVSVETKAQFSAAVTARGVSRIDLDAALLTDENGFSAEMAAAFSERARQAKKAIYLRLPFVFRARQRARCMQALSWLARCFDGVVARCIDAYAFCLAHLPADMPVSCDFTLYAFQREAAYFWRTGGLQHPAAARDIRLSAPIELNARALVENHGCWDALVVYGRYPMMVSACCVAKTTDTAHCADGRGCNQTGNMLYLTDRYKKRFPVKCFCADCCNVIYNSVPTSLIGERETIDKIGVPTLRVLLTTENAQESAQVIDCVCAAFGKEAQGAHSGNVCMPFTETTRGHWKRGVD